MRGAAVSLWASSQTEPQRLPCLSTEAALLDLGYGAGHIATPDELIEGELQ